MTLQATRPEGFTLIELVIVAAIIALFAMLAYPSFTDQIRKTRRVELIQYVLQCAAVLERRFTVNGSYDATGCDGLPPNPHYDTTVSTPDCASNGNNACFVITAVASSAFMQTDDDCKTYTYDHYGVKTALDIYDVLNTKNCWRN